MGTVVQSSPPTACDTPITLGSPVTAGNHLIAMFSYRFGVDVTLADNRSNTWQSPNGLQAGQNGTVKILFAENVAAGSTTVTPTIGTGAGSWVLQEVSDLSSVEAQNKGDVTDTSAPYQPGLALTTAASCHVVVVASDADNDARTCTGGAGSITNAVSMAAGNAYGYATNVAAGTITAGLTMNAGDTFAMQAYAFKNASGGPALNGAGTGRAGARSSASAAPGHRGSAAGRAGARSAASGSQIIARSGSCSSAAGGKSAASAVPGHRGAASSRSGAQGGAVGLPSAASKIITWTASGDGNGYAIGIDVVSRGAPGATAASYANYYDAGTALEYTFTHLVPGVTYYVGVSSYGSFAETALYSEVLLADEFSFVASLPTGSGSSRSGVRSSASETSARAGSGAARTGGKSAAGETSARSSSQTSRGGAASAAAGTSAIARFGAGVSTGGLKSAAGETTARAGSQASRAAGASAVAGGSGRAGSASSRAGGRSAAGETSLRAGTAATRAGAASSAVGSSAAIRSGAATTTCGARSSASGVPGAAAPTVLGVISARRRRWAARETRRRVA